MSGPHPVEVVDKGSDHLGEYVVTRCTEMSEPTDYGRRTVRAFYDRKMKKPRLEIKHYIKTVPS